VVPVQRSGVKLTVNSTKHTDDDNPAAVLYGVRDLRLQQRPVPRLGSDEVLVEIRAVGVCGSDVHYYEHGRIGDFVVDAPLVLGHESSGVIVAIGRDAGHRTVGERVALEPGVPCGRCEQCRHGRYNLCPDVRFFATPPVDGTLTRFVAINSDFAHPLPAELSDDAGAMIEPLSVALWANRKAGTAPGARVLVTGAGPIGLLCALVAQASGAADVTLVDVNDSRLAQATTLGVPHTAVAADPSDPADILLECTGVPSVVTEGIGVLRPAGTAVLVGMGPGATQPLPVARIQARELTITGTFRYAGTYPAAIALAAAGRIPLDRLVGARLPIDQAEQALLMGHSNPEILKTIVRFTDLGTDRAHRCPWLEKTARRLGDELHPRGDAGLLDVDLDWDVGRRVDQSVGVLDHGIVDER
jgi:L-iditol 2-dehydrogenase